MTTTCKNLPVRSLPRPEICVEIRLPLELSGNQSMCHFQAQGLPLSQHLKVSELDFPPLATSSPGGQVPKLTVKASFMPSVEQSQAHAFPLGGVPDISSFLVKATVGSSPLVDHAHPVRDQLPLTSWAGALTERPVFKIKRVEALRRPQWRTTTMAPTMTQFQFKYLLKTACKVKASSTFFVRGLRLEIY